MKLQYVSIWKLRGARKIVAASDSHELLRLTDPHTKVSVTNDPEPYFEHIDKWSAIANQLFSGGFAQTKQDTYNERIATEQEAVRASRAKRIKTGVFVVFEGELDVPTPDFNHRHDMATFSVCMDAVDKVEIQARFDPVINAVLAALGMVLPPNGDRQVEKVGSTAYLIDPDQSTPIYSFTIEVGEVRLSIATPLNEEHVSSAGRYALKFIEDQKITRSTKLLISSLVPGTDSLQAFVSAWSALEIFINKIFKANYKTSWFEILENGAPASAKPVFERFNTVMNDKYRLADKFLIIASVLDEESATVDNEKFCNLKAIRDNFLHGQETPAVLPTDMAQSLLVKYLKLHLERIE